MSFYFFCQCATDLNTLCFLVLVGDFDLIEISSPLLTFFLKSFMDIFHCSFSYMWVLLVGVPACKC
jgi:hypothetical protein